MSEESPEYRKKSYQIVDKIRTLVDELDKTLNEEQKMVGKEEKPKKLWEILQQRFRKHYVAPQCNKDSECMMSNLAKAAIEAVEKKIDEILDNTCFDTRHDKRAVKNKIRELL